MFQNQFGLGEFTIRGQIAHQFAQVSVHERRPPFQFEVIDAGDAGDSFGDAIGGQANESEAVVRWENTIAVGCILSVRIGCRWFWVRRGGFAVTTSIGRDGWDSDGHLDRWNRLNLRGKSVQGSGRGEVNL